MLFFIFMIFQNQNPRIMKMMKFKKILLEIKTILFLKTSQFESKKIILSEMKSLFMKTRIIRDDNEIK